MARDLVRVQGERIQHGLGQLVAPGVRSLDGTAQGFAGTGNWRLPLSALVFTVIPAGCAVLPRGIAAPACALGKGKVRVTVQKFTAIEGFDIAIGNLVAPINQALLEAGLVFR